MTHILVTNDDGVFSPGLLALKQALESVGRVSVIAPDRNRSAIARGITIHTPLHIEKDPQTHRRFVGKAVAETQRLEALITDILFLSELEATPGPVHGERCDLRLAAQEAVEVLAQRAREMRVAVELRPGGPTWVPG